MRPRAQSLVSMRRWGEELAESVSLRFSERSQEEDIGCQSWLGTKKYMHPSTNLNIQRQKWRLGYEAAAWTGQSIQGTTSFLWVAEPLGGGSTQLTRPWNYGRYFSVLTLK